MAGSNFGGIRTICPAFVPFCHSAEEKCAGDKITAKAGKTRLRGETKKGERSQASPCEGELPAAWKAELLKEKGDRSGQSGGVAA